MIKVNKYFIPYIIILLLLGFKGELFLDFLIVFFHELVHYVTARYYGFSGFDVEILPIGTVLKLKNLDEANLKEDLVISLSGPLINLILAVFFYFLNKKICCEYINVLFLGNLYIGIFNLIPAFPLDGGRILRDILSYKTLYKVANKIVVHISIFIGSIMLFYYIFLFFIGKHNFSIGLIALFIIISSLKEKERITYIIMGDIIKKKRKLIKRGYIENKNISVYYKRNLIDILNIVEKNKYNVFTILDDDMNFIDIIYEEELIDALKIYGNISIEKFINIKKEK